MSLHASMASRIYRSQKENNMYGDKWYERLKQINRIRKLTKEFYAKQQQQSQQAKPNSAVNSGASNANVTSNNVLNQSDFTNYI
jgi:hypothetical protein